MAIDSAVGAKLDNSLVLVFGSLILSDTTEYKFVIRSLRVSTSSHISLSVLFFCISSNLNANFFYIYNSFFLITIKYALYFVSFSPLISL